MKSLKLKICFPNGSKEQFHTVEYLIINKVMGDHRNNHLALLSTPLSCSLLFWV